MQVHGASAYDLVSAWASNSTAPAKAAMFKALVDVNEDVRNILQNDTTPVTVFAVKDETFLQQLSSNATEADLLYNTLLDPNSKSQGLLTQVRPMAFGASMAP